MANYRTRICVCYLITSFLISAFVYLLISSNLQNNRAISRLREEVDEIAHLVLHSAPGGEHESKQLTEVVDGILKKRLTGIWDDLYAVKKQLKATECDKRFLSKTKQPCEAMAEKVERINYASEDLGAKIDDVKAEPVCGTNVFKSLLRLDFTSNPPVNMLRQSMDPGSCFAFKESTAVVTVKLAKEIFVDSVEYEHISNALSPTADISSAPKSFEVYVNWRVHKSVPYLITSDDMSHPNSWHIIPNNTTADTHKGISPENPKAEQLLGNFQYDNSAEQRVQLFDVKTITKCGFVRFKFENNYGHPNYTCIYRIAVYGNL